MHSSPFPNTPTPHLSPHFFTLPRPLPTSSHTPTSAHTSPHLPLPQHTSYTSPHTPNTPPSTHLSTLPFTSHPPHPNTLPHSFRISPILDPTSLTAQNCPIPPPSILPQIFHTPPFFPISAITPISPVSAFSPNSHLRTANVLLFQNKATCKQVVAAN